MKRSSPVLTNFLGVLRKLDLVFEKLRRFLTPPEMVLFKDITAHWLQSALGVAVELDLADRIPLEGSLAIPCLANELGLSREPVLRLLRVLGAHGYFVLDAGESKLSHSRLSRALRSGVAKDFASLQTKDWYRGSFSTQALLRSLQGSVSAFEHVHGEEFFPHLLKCPDKLALFGRAMSDITRFCVPYLLDQMKVTPGSHVLDIGGSDGELCKGLARMQSQASFTVLDQGERKFNSNTVNYCEGDFFEKVPSGFDHLILKNILHDWSDLDCIRLLTNCRAAVGLNGRLTFIEVLLPEPGKSLGLAAQEFSVDWNISATLPGRERRRSEFEELLNHSGWRLLDSKPTATPFWVVEAVLDH